VREERRAQPRHGIPLRAVVPNAITALALCVGLTGVRFAIAGRWDLAVAMVVLAGVLDGMDGRIARALRGQTRFGAELDSLSDVIAFGVAPAIILHLWVLQMWPRVGWMFALAYAACMALRLARFNARIDAEDQPHKSAGYLTGVPAPAGAGLLLLPIIMWLASDQQWDWLHNRYLVATWAALIAFLVVSSLATFSWSSLRLRRNVRFEAIVVIVLIGGALLTEPWTTLSVAAVAYIASIPFSMATYARVKRLRRSSSASPPAPPATGATAPADAAAERLSTQQQSPPNLP
jgi:CDP-diacylglycerol--serine O-phosphatidyltransferase